jgi:hypothetical protein
MDGNNDTVDAVRVMVIGSLLADYGARLIIDGTKQEMKMHVNGIINAVKRFENYLIAHPNGNKESREQFKRAFNKNETVLLTDLLLTCWEIEEDGLEEIIKAIKQSIQEPPNE